MCVVVFDGEKSTTLLEAGMNTFAEINGFERDVDFFENYSGSGKLYPGGSTCVFKRKELPYLVRWTPKGSINGEILVEMLQTLDELGVYATERAEERTTFLVLDGHGSRL